MSESEMAQRIKELRTSQNLTLEQIATEVGVGKSTVRKWETGMIANMRRDKIASLARALHTTPEYLMGWESEPSIQDRNQTQELEDLSEKEIHLIKWFRSLPQETRRAILTLGGAPEEVNESPDS